MPAKLRLRGQEVEWQTRVRYLGVQIDRSMRMAAQVEHVIHQSRAARSMLRPVLGSHLPLRAKVALYKATSVPAHVRSSSMVRTLFHFAKKRIQGQQNIALRMVVGAGRYVFNDVIARDLCIETVEEFIQRIARRMFDIADQGPYEFLRNIAPMQERSPSGRPSQRTTTNTSSQTPELDSIRGLMYTERTPEGTITRTVGVVSPTRRRPGMKKNISPPSRTHTHEKGEKDPRTNANAYA
ncbi:hypothetical protein EVAR_36087_1 [Eumeta japonica]|uniref:Uncharacterized protein n=1 Tax=Eumeta variegata TaxID=151549 RepID=A0A4C1YJA7_EUMVA|nr:hypothetical protein EVAR_36087_1 [Eumeta japonica]